MMLNPEDATSINLEPGDLIEVIEESCDEAIVGKLEISNDVAKGSVVMDETSLECLYTDEHSEVLVETYDGLLIYLDSIKFGVKSVSGDNNSDFIIDIRKREYELLKFLNKRVLRKSFKIKWEDFIFEVVETEPPIQGDEVGIISKEVLSGFSYKPMSTMIPFDTILIMDVSTSMVTQDLRLEGFSAPINHLKSSVDKSEIRDYLDSFFDEEEIRRCDGAALAALLYLSEKVGRGKGEKIGLIPFSTSGQIVQFDDAFYYDVSKDVDISKIMMSLVKHVTEAEGSTNISHALLQALHIIEKFNSDRIKMLILLTDGKPEKVDNDARVVECIEKYFRPREDILLYAAGLGNNVNEELLKDITSRCGGEYYQVQKIDDLVSWYSYLAKNLVLHATHLKEEEIQNEIIYDFKQEPFAEIPCYGCKSRIPLPNKGSEIDISCPNCKRKGTVVMGDTMYVRWWKNDSRKKPNEKAQAVSTSSGMQFHKVPYRCPWCEKTLYGNADETKLLCKNCSYKYNK